eukprot:350001-Chlamydomonas_euryale.AAC.3
MPDVCMPALTRALQTEKFFDALGSVSFLALTAGSLAAGPITPRKVLLACVHATMHACQYEACLQPAPPRLERGAHAAPHVCTHTRVRLRPTFSVLSRSTSSAVSSNIGPPSTMHALAALPSPPSYAALCARMATLARLLASGEAATAKRHRQ